MIEKLKLIVGADPLYQSQQNHICSKINELITSHNEALKEISILHQQHLHLVEAMAKLISNNQT